MKHRFFLAIALIAMTLLNTGCNDQAVAPTQLPANIQAFVQQNFPDTKWNCPTDWNSNSTNKVLSPKSTTNV